MTKSWLPGIYAIEGLDGSGKSTVARALYRKLDADGVLVTLTCFPSKDGEIGTLIRRALVKQAEIREEALYLLFAADGVDRLPRLRDLVSQGHVVICDRHTLLSQFAYQVRDRGLLSVLQACQRVPPPDMTFILDLPAEEAMQRVVMRGETRSIYEEAAHFEGVRARYLALGACGIVSPDRLFYIEANQSPEIVADLVYDAGCRMSGRNN